MWNFVIVNIDDFVILGFGFLEYNKVDISL